jgi:transposase
LKESILRYRDEYVMRMIAENEAKKRRIVYMDESYIHKNYCRHEDSLYDPNDEQDLTTIAIHKGQRYCFIAAILDADHSVPESERTDAQKATLMKETLDIFEGGKKQTQDYHGMFDHEYFVQWMQKLLDGLRNRGISNALIVMDNAKYHKTLPETTPRKAWKKEKLLQACASLNIEVPQTAIKTQIWSKLEPHVKGTLPVICAMAKAEGHEVLYSPPHYSDLQPIEIVWANVKGAVGRQYTTTTTFKDVLDRLQTAFDDLQEHTIQGCINKANKQLQSLHKHILKVDDDGEEDEDDDEDEGESNDEDEVEDENEDSNDEDQEAY